MSAPGLSRAIVPVIVAAALFVSLGLAVSVVPMLHADPVSVQIALKVTLAVAALAVGLMGGLSFAQMGVKRGRGKWLGLALLALLLGAIVGAAMVYFQLPRNPMLEAFSPLQFLLVIVGLSSISEEILCRGYLQGALEKALGETRLFALPVPVLVSALFFATMHLGLARMVAPITLGVTLAFTATLGLAAAFARQQSGGLLAPIVIHALGNVGGVIGAAVVSIILHVLVRV
jgi:membrane protease YdiL (CAAX protease family)